LCSFATLLLEIKQTRLLKLKCKSMEALSEATITYCLSYLLREDGDMNETYCRY
jgi:hypothetical protein